jgi:hypothetical protein
MVFKLLCNTASSLPMHLFAGIGDRLSALNLPVCLLSCLCIYSLHFFFFSTFLPLNTQNITSLQFREESDHSLAANLALSSGGGFQVPQVGFPLLF